MDGYDKFVSVCIDSGCRSKLSEDEWRNKKIIIHSYIPIACDKCPKDDITVRIADFVRTGVFSCFCKKKRAGYKRESWKVDKGFIRLEKVCKEKGVIPMFGDKKSDVQLWYQKNFVAGSVITFKCLKCKVKVDKPVRKITNGKINCACHKNFAWKTPEKYKLFSLECEKRNCELQISLKDWMRDVKNNCSKVPTYCRKCHRTCKTTSIDHFMVGQLSCGCKNKSEKIVRGFLEEVFGEDRILEGRVDWCLNPVTGFKLPFDMVIGDLKIIVEVDGQQHYQEVNYFQTGLNLEERMESVKTKSLLLKHYDNEPIVNVIFPHLI